VKPIQYASESDAGATAEPVRLLPAARSTFNERWLVALGDGSRVECVAYRGDTLCISSQVGCAVACPFCASGSRGYARGLALEELIGQVEAVRACGYALKRVTLSGVGEPLHNHAAALALLDWCRTQRLGLSVTTSGGPLARLAEWLHAPHNGLTISVHAGSEPVRARMVPKGPALEPLFELLEREVRRMTQRRRRKTALAYLMCEGVNDSPAELTQFAQRAAVLDLPVHLYAYNEVPTSQFKPVARADYERAHAQLVAAGLTVRMSSQARIESNGGCGSLVAVARGPRA